jgi:hypothetical protein
MFNINVPFGNQHITDQLYRKIVFSINSLISKKGDILTEAGKTEFLPIIHWNLKWSLFQLYFDLVILKFVGPPVVLPLNIPYIVYLERGPLTFCFVYYSFNPASVKMSPFLDINEFIENTIVLYNRSVMCWFPNEALIFLWFYLV